MIYGMKMRRQGKVQNVTKEYNNVEQKYQIKMKVWQQSKNYYYYTFINSFKYKQWLSSN